MLEERKIGEVFTDGGKEYIVSISPDEGSCEGCSFRESVGPNYSCFKHRDNIGPCSALDREDRRSVIFVDKSNIQKEAESVEVEGENDSKFDIELAKKGESIHTRDNRKARLICSDVKGDYIVVLVEDENGNEEVYKYRKDGKLKGLNYFEYDLFMGSAKEVGYINLYQSDGELINTPLLSKEKAIKAIHRQTEDNNVIYLLTLEIRYQNVYGGIIIKEVSKKDLLEDIGW